MAVISGILGIPAGIKSGDGSDGGDDPDRFVAITVAVKAIPLTRPGMMADKSVTVAV
jgi:hypothetical protein